MAGNPLAKLLPYVKTYATEIYIGLGVGAFLLRSYNNNWTYRFVYSKNDFERKKSIDDISAHLTAKH